jgi:hypothetical protein
MRLQQYINELASEYGKGITFIDIDETLFKTFAKILVIKNNKTIKELNNQEFNTYELQDGESFDFHQFENAKLFKETSIPIPQTIKRVKRMLKNIDIRGSKIIFLTARSDFDNKHEFLQTFRDNGIDIDKIYVERVGNKKTGTVAEKKKQVVLKYLKTGLYRRCRLIDDDMANIKTFIKIEKDLPQSIINKVKDHHNIPENENFPVVSFYGLLVKSAGNLKKIT